MSNNIFGCRYNMKNIKQKSPNWIIVFLLLGLFSYHWAMSTIERGVQFRQEFRTHEFTIDNTINVNDSTGIMVGWDEKLSLGYILTCAHVVKGFEEVPVITIDHDATPHIEFGKVLHADYARDLAIVTVKKKMPLFTVMSDSDFKRHVKPGMVVWASGYPTDDPAGQMLSVGYVIMTDYSIKCPYCPEHEEVRGIKHNATIWYGNSGGPLIDPSTGQVIGLNYKLVGVLKSDAGIAIPAPTVNAFLKEHGLK